VEGVPTVPGSDFPYLEATVAELQAGMTDGRLTAEALVAAYIARIRSIDHDGPTIRSVIELNPEALDIAAALDQERQDRGSRGPLHGIPVLLKDNIATADGMQTTAGSLALVDVKVTRDAHLVARLREAGAVILGKSNLSEWANIRSTRSTSGWSARGGLTRNPYALDRNTSGSSSGSAAAIAANFAAVAVGTETDGSIVSPSSINGLVGLKPTVGLVSRDGVIPISQTQDTAGPMTRTVADAAALLGAMVGPDERDAATADTVAADYSQFLDATQLVGARLGVVRTELCGHDGVNEVFERALATLRAQGAVVIDPVELKTDMLEEPELEVLLHELKPGLRAWFAEFAPSAPVSTLGELIEWNEHHRASEMPWFGQELFEQAESRGALTSEVYLNALTRCRRSARDEGIDAVLGEHGLDALVAPTSSPAWMTDLVNGDHHTASFSTPAAVAGYPHLTVPAGFVHGLPVGLSFVGPAWSEACLIGLGYSFERVAQARRAPTFAPTNAAHA
jgi:amidase